MATSEQHVQHDGVRESTPTRSAPEAFSGADRMNLFKSYDQTVLSGTNPAGARQGDGALPTHVTFDNIYGNSVFNQGAQGDKGVKVAGLNDGVTPKAESSPFLERLQNQYLNEAGNFAFGSAMTAADAAAGKAKLQAMTEHVFQNGGEKGLQELAAQLNDRALEKYGDHAFERAPAQFDRSLANVRVTPNKDGSSQVQYDFAQPGSDKGKTVIFQIGKPEVGKVRPHPITGNYEI